MKPRLKDYFTKGYYPYERQKDGIKFLMKHHYCILNGKPGVGKTIMATAVMCLSGGKSICVVPSSLKINWKKEIGKYCDKKVEVINTGSAAGKANFSSADIIIISYSLLHKLPDSTLSSTKNYIFDEAHYLCNLESDRTQVAHQIIEDYAPERAILLSGTPIKNRVGEYYSLLALCSYNQKGTSGVDISISYPDQYSWNDTFSYREEYKVGRRRLVRYSGTRNIPELKRLLKNKIMKITLEEVTEIPPLLEKDVIVEYNESSLIDAWADFNTDRSKTHIASSKAKAALLKAPFTKDYANDLLSSGEPVVVFTDHVASAHTIHKGIKNSRLITGATPTKQRAAYVEGFQNGEFDCLVATIGSANTGFTLTRASNMVVNDLAWVEADNEQMRKRIHRISQTKKAVIHYILGSKIDIKIKKILQEKIKNLKEIV